MARKPTTERDGRKLAAKMLREMETYQTGGPTGCWPWSIRAIYRPLGAQQDNVILRYIDSMQGNRAALAGFCAVITDHIGQGEVGGGTLFPWAYEKVTDLEAKGDPEAWPTLDENGHEVKVRVAQPG
jgi:hypothetical protein